jgi:hypothetical protein
MPFLSSAPLMPVCQIVSAALEIRTKPPDRLNMALQSLSYLPDISNTMILYSQCCLVKLGKIWLSEGEYVITESQENISCTLLFRLLIYGFLRTIIVPFARLGPYSPNPSYSEVEK